ncbi:MAG: transcription antitermination factor NusB [Planctomycetes bacterium]|nr:transcription antitermination factor NusB [Planctomycetota bacterium]
MRPRSQAREAALKALYQVDLRPDLTDAEVDELLRADARNEESLAFARELVTGTRAHMAEIDQEVESIAHNWNLKRMAVIDRNVIRLGAFELIHRKDIPPAVAINEAVEMAKKYSTKDSGSFVNGILDKIHHRHHGVKAGRAARAPKQEG